LKLTVKSKAAYIGRR